MFTGIIEEIGRIISISKFGNGLRINFMGDKVFGDLKIDDSVSINGVCQTVISVHGKTATVEAVEETLNHTTFNQLTVNQPVNLERALLPTTRMGGHIVQGHIDTTGKIIKISNLSASTLFEIEFPAKYRKYIINKGSVCVDGVSLTVSEADQSKFCLSIIPHTLKNTVIAGYKTGTEVNLEFDVLGKYIENLIKVNPAESKKSFLDRFIDQPEF